MKLHINKEQVLKWNKFFKAAKLTATNLARQMKDLKEELESKTQQAKGEEVQLSFEAFHQTLLQHQPNYNIKDLEAPITPATVSALVAKDTSEDTSRATPIAHDIGKVEANELDVKAIATHEVKATL